MADYFAFPLWIETPGLPFEHASSDTLSISSSLRGKLAAWAVEYDRSALTDRWPDLVAEWNQRGQALARLLAAELTAPWEVVYFDEVTGDEIVISSLG